MKTRSKSVSVRRSPRKYVSMRVEKRYTRPAPKSSSSSSSATADYIPDDRIYPELTDELKYDNHFLTEFMTILDHSTYSNNPDFLTWARIAEYSRDIVDRIIYNRYTHVRTISSNNIIMKDTYIIPNMFNNIREYIYQWLIKCQNNLSLFLNYHRELTEQIQKINKAAKEYMCEDFDIDRHINNPVKDAIREYWADIVSVPYGELANFYRYFKGTHSDKVKEFLSRIWKISAVLFHNKGLSHYIIKVDDIPDDLDQLYGYMYVHINYKKYTSHIWSFTVNYNDKSIELYDANPTQSQSYMLYGEFIRCLCGRPYTVKIVNNTSLNIQDIVKDYIDLYCLGWTTLFIYNRLIRDVSMEDFRRTYLSDLHGALEDVPQPEDVKALRRYRSAIIYYRGFANEVKLFILATIKLIAPRLPRLRMKYLNDLLNNNDKVVERMDIYVQDSVSKLTLSEPYY